jgi:RNA polymerase sigma-70 factor, ECF subfamily
MTDIALVDATAVATMVRLAADGDEPAFARLVAEHHASMARVAYVVTGDAELTEDAVQTAWSIAWRRLGNVRDPEQVRAWLVAIAANEARQIVRRRRRVTVVDISEALDRSGGGDPADRIGVLDLERVLRKLGPDDRVLLALRFVAELDSIEIATQLRLSASGVRSRLARLLERVRADLTPTQGSKS